MIGDTVALWAEELPEPESQLMLLKAAKEHEAKFTNPEMIGMMWAAKLRRNGFNALCPYARDYVAKRYEQWCSV